MVASHARSAACVTVGETPLTGLVSSSGQTFHRSLSETVSDAGSTQLLDFETLVLGCDGEDSVSPCSAWSADRWAALLFSLEFRYRHFSARWPLLVRLGLA